jgi:hypothetical protein
MITKKTTSKAAGSAPRFLAATLLLLAVMGLIPAKTLAQKQAEITITSREIVERLTRIEEGQKRLETQLTQRIDGVETTLNRRIDELRQFILRGFGVTFAGIFALIGFVIWDRRAALAPAIHRTERIEAALREYAAKSPELAEALKKVGLL